MVARQAIQTQAERMLGSLDVNTVFKTTSRNHALSACLSPATGPTLYFEKVPFEANCLKS